VTGVFHCKFSLFFTIGNSIYIQGYIIRFEMNSGPAFYVHRQETGHIGIALYIPRFSNQER